MILICIFVKVQNLVKKWASEGKPIQFNDKPAYYSIQEVADHVAVNISLLRFWEKEFENINPKKTAGGTRQYTREDIQQVEIVHHLVKEKGLTLEGARQSLKSKKTMRLSVWKRWKNLRK